MDSNLVVALVGVAGVLVGAGTTAVFSLLTWHLGRRHEERRWLLENRYAVYTNFNIAYRKWDERPDAASAEGLIGELHVAIDSLALLASTPTLRQAQELVWLVRATSEDPSKDTEAAVLRRAEANKVLLFRQRGDLSTRRSDRRAWEQLTRGTVLGEPEF